MPRVVPSQVVQLLNTAFRGAIEAPTQHPLIGPEHAPTLRAILRLASEIPTELLTFSADDYADYAAALGAIEHSLAHWLHRGGSEGLMGAKRPGGWNTIALLNRALGKCPDQAPAQSTVTLQFITDPDLRASIRQDVSSANRGLIDGSYKGATVLAASASEALLLWALEHKRTDRQGGVRTPQAPGDVPGAVAACKGLSSKPPSNLDDWNLHQFIEVALQLNLISDETAKQLRLAKDFRNLIHPGRAKRLAATCDRGTALAALAGVEFAVRDLK